MSRETQAIAANFDLILRSLRGADAQGQPQTTGHSEGSGAEPRRAVAGLGYYDVEQTSQTETTARASAEMPTAPTHFEFNEEEQADGPDPYDAQIRKSSAAPSAAEGSVLPISVGVRTDPSFSQHEAAHEAWLQTMSGCDE